VATTAVRRRSTCAIRKSGWLKEFSISSRLTSWDAIKNEIDRTILLCANCHREVHDGLHPGFLEHEPIGTLDAWDYAEDPDA